MVVMGYREKEGGAQEIREAEMERRRESECRDLAFDVGVWIGRREEERYLRTLKRRLASNGQIFYPWVGFRLMAPNGQICNFNESDRWGRNPKSGLPSGSSDY